jgi:site-specific recombinase XerD
MHDPEAPQKDGGGTRIGRPPLMDISPCPLSPTDGLPLNSLARRFERWLAAQETEGITLPTIRAWRSDFNKWAALLSYSEDDHWEHFASNSITAERIDAAIEKMREAGYAPTSVRRAVTSLRSILGGLDRTNGCDGREFATPSIMRSLTIRQAEATSVRTLTLTQVSALRDAALDPPGSARSAWEERDALLILLLGHVGLTSQEVCKLRMSDMRPSGDDELWVYVVGRGSRHRELRCGTEYRARWGRVQEKRTHLIDESRPAEELPAFVKRDGSPITGSALRTIVSRASASSGLPHLSPQDLTVAARRNAAAQAQEVLGSAARFGLGTLAPLTR